MALLRPACALGYSSSLCLPQPGGKPCEKALGLETGLCYGRFEDTHQECCGSGPAGWHGL